MDFDDPVIHSVSLGDLHKRMEIVIDSIKEALPGKHPGEKVLNVTSLIGALAEYHQENGTKKIEMLESLEANHYNTWWAVTEAHRITYSHRNLNRDNLVSDYFDCLRYGKFPPIDNGKIILQSQQNNREFEYYTAAIMQQSDCVISGINIKGKDNIVRDVTATFENQKIVVECKRVFSHSQFTEIAKEAKKILLRTKGKIFRIIVIDISLIKYDDTLRYNHWTDKAIHKYIRTKVSRYNSFIKPYVADDRIHLVILETLVPYAQAEFAPCSYKFRSFAKYNIVNREQFRLLRKMYSCNE